MSNDTRPGDLVGQDANGRTRIDRVIPLTWLVGIVGIGVAQAFAQYYGLVQIRETVAELKTDVRAMRVELSLSSSRGQLHDYQLADHERRLNNLETKGKP